MTIAVGIDTMRLMFKNLLETQIIVLVNTPTINRVNKLNIDKGKCRFGFIVGG